MQRRGPPGGSETAEQIRALYDDYQLKNQVALNTGRTFKSALEDMLVFLNENYPGLELFLTTKDCEKGRLGEVLERIAENPVSDILKEQWSRARVDPQYHQLLQNYAVAYDADKHASRLSKEAHDIYYSAFEQALGEGKPHRKALRGGNVSPSVMHYALGEDDIRKVCGNVPILRYPELQKFSTPEEMFQGSDAAVLLFLTEDMNNGHWLCVLNHPDHYEVFDSFGVSVS